MQDFHPDELLSFDLEKGEQEVLFQKINLPTLIRGAYYVNNNQEDKINFHIQAPNLTYVSTIFNKREGIYYINLTDVGEYRFVFDNLKGSSKKTVTFAIDIAD